MVSWLACDIVPGELAFRIVEFALGLGGDLTGWLFESLSLSLGGPNHCSFALHQSCLSDDMSTMHLDGSYAVRLSQMLHY